MKGLSAQYPRYGYRRIRIFLGRDGRRMSPGRAHRLWRAAGSTAQAAEEAGGGRAPAGASAVRAERGLVL
jgi:hypothetical protein